MTETQISTILKEIKARTTNISIFDDSSLIKNYIKKAEYDINKQVGKK